MNTVDNKDESIATTYQEIKNFKDDCKFYSKEKEEVFSGFFPGMEER